MSLSTISMLLSATAFASSLLGLTCKLVPLVVELSKRIVAFRENPITPTATRDFEIGIRAVLQEIGRVIVEWVFNRVEPTDSAEAPQHVQFDNNIYRRRDPSPRRFGVATLFGVIAFWRIRYEPCDEGIGLRCIFPLEERLGLLVGKATPALAQRLGPWAAQHTQQSVLKLLLEEHQVPWSVQKLRDMTAALSQAVTPFLHDAQVARLLELMKRAHDSTGPHLPVLVVGRDGIFLPIVNNVKYREACTATLSVFDRNGKNLGTMYLGQMPESGQLRLSRQLTDLILAVLRGWNGPMPRLEYVTDGGFHPTDYFESTLKTMLHPVTQLPLQWEWVIDFYHACLYITKMADAMFGRGTKQAATWAAKMRHWMKHKKRGVFRVLHSAAALACRLEFTKKERENFDVGYEYLLNRMNLMDYVDYRSRGLAIGSGITEAACKIVFTQRFKQSGMKWSLEGGQTIVDLRVIHLSGLWTAVYDAYQRSLTQLQTGTRLELNCHSYRIAA